MHDKREELDDEIAVLLKTVADHFNNEDRATRERQIRHWRRLKLYWNNFSNVYWSESAQDYKIYNQSNDSSANDQAYYDKPVNMFKAFLETIIAALSVQIPAINCVPDDADNPLDISTAKAGDKISELVYKHNDVIFLWLHALYIYCTEGLIACYNYPDADKSYGTYDVPKFKEFDEEAYVCPQCGTQIPDWMISQPQAEEGLEESDELGEDPFAVQQQVECLECGAPIPPDLLKAPFKVRRLVGVTEEPKSRVCLEVYGGLYVKVANYAKSQADTPYLIFSHETHYANALESYSELREKIPHGGWSNTGVNDPYEQYGRLNTQYRGEYPEETVTIKNCWLRVSAFNILPEEDYQKLKKKFPRGVRFVMVNDVPAEYEGEALDDHWTLTQNPMSDYLNHEPLGELLTNIQDIVNDLISLTLQTIEHGIAQTWVDPSVVNLNAQRQIEAMPGTLTATKPVAGTKNISEAFHTSQTASLSPEIFNFFRIIQELGQFVSGALPSLFGGQQGGDSSRTASEYAMSKGMAMQRLQTPFRMLTIWWKKIFAKVIPMYMQNMVDDERIVMKNDAGKFINVFIRKAEMDGSIGSIELEPSDKLPITDEQQADWIMQLMQLNNQQIMGILLDPANIPYIAKVCKISGLHIPGEDDREKQNEEIDELLNSTPIPPDEQSIALYEQAVQIDPNAVQPTEQPSVEIDSDVDNHEIEATICKEWAISAAGRLAKKENPEGYRNVLLHMKAHMAIVQEMQAQQQLHEDQLRLAGAKDQQNSADGGQKIGASAPTKPKQAEKVKDESNARNPIE